MRLNVTGLETIEVTDPKGICNTGQPRPTRTGKPVVPATPKGGNPWQPTTPEPQPMIPTPFGPSTIPDNPIPLPRKPFSDRPLQPTVYKKDYLHDKKWQTGLSGDPPGSVARADDGGKWTRGMQLAIAGEELKAGQLVMEKKDGNRNPTYSS